MHLHALDSAEVLRGVQSHLGCRTPRYTIFLELLHQILTADDSHHVSQHVVNLAELLQEVPKTFYKLNPLFYPHVRVDYDVRQQPITTLVLKTSDSSRIVVLDSHPDRLPFHNLSTVQFKDILLCRESGIITYKDLGATTDVALQGCLAQLAQNILDDPIASKDCRNEVITFLRRPTGIPPSLFLHDLAELDAFEYTSLSDLFSGVIGDLKVIIKRPRVCLDPRDCVQIIREIILCRQFHHPNILPFLGATFHQQSRLCGLVTPYMKNGNLLSFLESNPSIERLTPIWQIMKGLEFLHNFKPPVAHRDIKCANVLVNDDLVCCLSDFGLSSIPELSQRSRQRAAGTRSWMAPEILSLPPADDRIDLLKADVFSLGVTILEVYLGYPPEMVYVLHKIKEAPAGKAPHFLSRSYSSPPYLSELILKMLDVEPSARLSVRMSCQALEDNCDFPRTIEGIEHQPGLSSGACKPSFDTSEIQTSALEWIKHEQERDRAIVNQMPTKAAPPRLTIPRLPGGSPAVSNNKRIANHILLRKPTLPCSPMSALSGYEEIHGLPTPVTGSSSSPAIAPTVLSQEVKPLGPPTPPCRLAISNLVTPPETPYFPRRILQPRPMHADGQPSPLYPRDPTNFITPNKNHRKLTVRLVPSRLRCHDSDDPPSTPSSPKRGRDSFSSHDGDNECENIAPSTLVQRLYEGLQEGDFRSPSPAKRPRHNATPSSPTAVSGRLAEAGSSAI